MIELEYNNNKPCHGHNQSAGLPVHNMKIKNTYQKNNNKPRY